MILSSFFASSITASVTQLYEESTNQVRFGFLRIYQPSPSAFYNAQIKLFIPPFALTKDSFPKIIVRHDVRKRWYDDNVILNIGIIDFLLDESII